MSLSLSSEKKAILVWSPDSAFFLPCRKTSEMAKDKEVATLLTWFSVQQRGKRALKYKWLECSPGKASDSESFWGELGTGREDRTLQVLPKSLSDKGSSAPLVSCFPKRKLQECTKYRDETPCSYHPLNRKSTSHTGMYLTLSLKSYTGDLMLQLKWMMARWWRDMTVVPSPGAA